MNVVFLDVDGVLNSLPFFNNSDSELNPENVKNLEEICDRGNAVVVLASTWRELKGVSGDAGALYERLLCTLDEYGVVVIDSTPVLRNKRPLEIATWLKENSVDCFVILDDDFPKCEYDEYGLGEFLVQTKFFCERLEDGGLQKEHVKQALAILEVV